MPTTLCYAEAGGGHGNPALQVLEAAFGNTDGLGVCPLLGHAPKRVGEDKDSHE